MATKLTVSITVNAPLKKVWDAMWNPEHIVHWCFASDDWHCPKSVSPEPAVGVIFSNTFAAKDGSFSFDLVGKYDVVEPMERVIYTMGEMKEYFLPAGRVVDITFTPHPLTPSPSEKGDSETPSPLGDKGRQECSCTTHSELEAKQGRGEVGGILVTETFDAEDIHSAEQQIAGWQAILDNFRKYVESI